MAETGKSFILSYIINSFEPSLTKNNEVNFQKYDTEKYQLAVLAIKAAASLINGKTVHSWADWYG